MKTPRYFFCISILGPKQNECFSFRHGSPLIVLIPRFYKAKEKKIPVIYACDSRYADDSLFDKLGIKPHTIKGTEGVKVINELAPLPEDVIVEKRMMSGFFGSDLDFTLRQKKVKRLIITGVRTEFCLLKTVLDQLRKRKTTTVRFMGNIKNPLIANIFNLLGKHGFIKGGYFGPFVLKNIRYKNKKGLYNIRNWYLNGLWTEGYSI